MEGTEPHATESSEPTVTPAPTVIPSEAEATATEAEAKATETAPAPVDWRQNFTVKEDTTVETVERLSIVVGVNEYKGQMLVFLAKVTDKNFSRQFFSMPAWVWDKVVPVLQGYTSRVGEIEKKAMAERALAELKRLQELGVDVKGIIEKLG